MPEIVITGPNGPSEIHAVGCADLKKGKHKLYSDEQWIIDIDSWQDLAESIWGYPKRMPCVPSIPEFITATEDVLSASQDESHPGESVDGIAPLGTVLGFTECRDELRNGHKVGWFIRVFNADNEFIGHRIILANPSVNEFTAHGQAFSTVSNCGWWKMNHHSFNDDFTVTRNVFTSRG